MGKKGNTKNERIDYLKKVLRGIYIGCIISYIIIFIAGFITECYCVVKLDTIEENLDETKELMKELDDSISALYDALTARHDALMDFYNKANSIN